MIGMLSLDMIFTLIFCPFSIQLHPLSLLPFSSYAYLSYVSSVYALSCSWTDDKTTIQLVTTNHWNLIYLAMDIPKQSCSPTTWSCAGTSLAALTCSHNSKFRTSRTRSMSRSASTTQRPRLIIRFLISTTTRSPWLTASIQWTTSSDLARDTSNPTGTGTGCIEGFFGTENGKENSIKSTKSISNFCIWKSVKKVKLFLLCHSLFPEKFNFLYTFSDTEIANRFCTFYTIFFTIFCFKKSFYAPCAGWGHQLPQVCSGLSTECRDGEGNGICESSSLCL